MFCIFRRWAGLYGVFVLYIVIIIAAIANKPHLINFSILLCLKVKEVNPYIYYYSRHY